MSSGPISDLLIDALPSSGSGAIYDLGLDLPLSSGSGPIFDVALDFNPTSGAGPIFGFMLSVGNATVKGELIVGSTVYATRTIGTTTDGEF